MPVADGSQVVATCGGCKPPAIVIVEDEALVASYIAEVLAGSGYRIAGICASAAEALSLAADKRPDLALIDIRLKGPIDGIETACLLRHRFGIPAIFPSGMADPETEAEAQAAHPLGFLHKPVLPSQVFNAVERALHLLAH